MVSTQVSPLYLVWAIVVLLFTTSVHALPYNAISPYPKAYWPATAGLFYHRCSSPTQVEFSKNQYEWYPSAICQRGTCCSNLAKSPACSLEACDLVEQEYKKSEEMKSKFGGTTGTTGSGTTGSGTKGSGTKGSGIWGSTKGH